MGGADRWTVGGRCPKVELWRHGKQSKEAGGRCPKVELWRHGKQSREAAELLRTFHACFKASISTLFAFFSPASARPSVCAFLFFCISTIFCLCAVWNMYRHLNNEGPSYEKK